MEAYLDNSATTRCSEEAVKKMEHLFFTCYGNPSSLHQKGMDAETEMKEAQKKVAKTLKVKESEIIFTSGGTESNNIAILGGVSANKRSGKKIITTAIEHPSVKNPFLHLQEEGYEVAFLPVNGEGIVDLEVFRKEMTEDTFFVSVMQVNNEIGSVQPIAEMVAIAREINPKVVFHVDAIQSYGKLLIQPKKMDIDLLSVSGHKIHGPKGSGFLYIKDKTKVNSIVYGGGQQKGLRSGTENVPAIAGLGVAAEEIYTDFEEKISHLREMRAYLKQEFSGIDGVQINGAQEEEAAPHILSVSVEGVRAEVLLHALEDKGIYVSAGSACSSNKPAISATLTAIGLKKELLDSTVRFSLSYRNTMEEMEYAVSVMKEIVPALQRFTRR